MNNLAARIRAFVAREPVAVRALLAAIAAIVAIVIPGVDVGTVEGVIFALGASLLGLDARSKVSPV